MPARNIFCPADISWQDSGEPYSERYKDFYFSTTDGLQESEYVFLRHNHFPQRFAKKGPLTLGETGFGSGLNFLVTACHWQQYTDRWTDKNPDSRSLQYISCEKYPFSRPQLHTVLRTFKQRWPCLAAVCEQLLAVYPDTDYPHQDQHSPGENHSIRLTLPGQIQLQLLLGDATEQLQRLYRKNLAKMDAWYLDGFAPAKNSSMWTPALFHQIAMLSHPETTLSTFTAVSEVRRNLTDAGFKMQKTAGFGLKREMLYGVFA